MREAIARHAGVTAAAAVVVALFAFGARAQDKKVDPPAAAKTEKKTPVVCNKLKSQATCEARSDCNWVGETKKDDKVTKKAYCRANPGSAKKADAKKTEPKKN